MRLKAGLQTAITAEEEKDKALVEDGAGRSPAERELNFSFKLSKHRKSS